MGRAIVREPAAFLFDEPLSNLDAKLRNQMRIEIKRSLQRSPWHHQRLCDPRPARSHDDGGSAWSCSTAATSNRSVRSDRDLSTRLRQHFVASFIGSPAMNLLPATYNGNGHVALADNLALPIEASTNHTGDVHLGIRPEEVHLTDQGQTPFQLELVEELGASRLLHGKLAGHEFTVNAPNDTTRLEGTLLLDLPANALHLFDQETGQRL
jgi:sn-glycerol 3-phosphate transport system ATP-binding protein